MFSRTKLYALLAATCLGHSVLAVPWGSGSTTTSKSSPTSSSTSSAYPEATYCKKGQQFNRYVEDINFDNITAIPGDTENPVPTPYDRLYFQSWVVIDAIITGVAPGVEPHSPPNAIATASEQQILNGQPLVSTIYANSNVTAFDLFSFYYDCTDDAPEGAAGVAAQCDVTVTGYQGSTNVVSGAKEVCAHTFSFLPPTAIADTQQAYTGPITDCLNLQFATFDYFGTGEFSGLTSDVALVIDDLEVAVYTCT